MKKLFLLFFLFLCGCSNKVSLSCSHIDNSSILGIKKVNDVIDFKNNIIISYKRNVILQGNSNSDSKSVYKVVKLEGKALKKYIGGKYKISRNNDLVSMNFSSKKTNNLNYIGIDKSYSYDEVSSIYNEMGFECK